MASGSSSGSSSSDVKKENLFAAANEGASGPVTNAPHLLDRQAVEYRIVIPTMGRWRPANRVNSACRQETRPFILVKTLSLLSRQGIPARRVTLFVSDKGEKENYATVLNGSPWEGVDIVVGVRGIRAQRNFIVKHFEPNAYIVSLDDDLHDIIWKSRPGNSADTVQSLPAGGLQALIFDAHSRMKKYGAWICGLCVSDNPMSMQIDGLSTRNGEVNGFLYFFINRHDEELLPTVADATEDAERSLRYFRKDGVVLRYRQYAGKTLVFKNRGGLQSLFGEWDEHTDALKQKRKAAEREAAATLFGMFPGLVGSPKQKKTAETLEVNFLKKGGPPIPSTSVEAFKANVAREKDARPPTGPSTGGAKDGAEAFPRRASKKKNESGSRQVTLPLTRSSEDEASVVIARGESSASSSVFTEARKPTTSSFEADCDSESGDDEDDQLLEAVRRSQEEQKRQGTSALAEDDLAFQAILRNINGSFTDPAAAEEEAIRLSKAAADTERRMLEAEQKQFEEALARSLFDQGPSPAASSANDGAIGATSTASVSLARKDFTEQQTTTAGVKRSLSISSSSLCSTDGSTNVDGYDVHVRRRVEDAASDAATALAPSLPEAERPTAADRLSGVRQRVLARLAGGAE